MALMFARTLKRDRGNNYTLREVRISARRRKFSLTFPRDFSDHDQTTV